MNLKYELTFADEAFVVGLTTVLFAVVFKDHFAFN